MDLKEIYTELLKIGATLDTVRVDNVSNMRKIVGCYDHVALIATNVKNLIEKAGGSNGEQN